jgi:hypothetical protein
MSTPAWVIQVGIAIHTSPRGKPEANDCRATAASRQLLNMSATLCAVPMRAGAGLAAAPAVLGGALAVVVILDPRITRDVRRSLYPKKMTADDEKMDPSESKWES